MVVFICNSCGDTLKKNAVEKHNYKCRLSQGVSCIDCNKTFGDDYTTHLSCITEDQKYGGTGYVHKEGNGQKKQDRWLENISNFLDNTTNIKPEIRQMLQKILKFSNIPRKEKQFKNFLSSCLKVKLPIAEQCWDVIKGVAKPVAPPPTQNGQAPKENGQAKSKEDTAKNEEAKDKEETVNGDQPKKKKKSKKEKTESNEEEKSKKRKNEEEEEGKVDESTQPKKKSKSSIPNGNHQIADSSNTEKKSKKSKKTKITEEEETEKQNGGMEHSNTNDDSLNNSVSSPSSFKWKNSIKKALKETPERKMKIKKLQKKVLPEYLSSLGEAHAQNGFQEEAKELFRKKLESDKFVIEDNFVKIK